MKKMKKMASFLLAMLMALALAVPAMAAGTTAGTAPNDSNNTTTTKEGPFKITIQSNETTEATAGHKYAAYQIFGGDLITDADGKDVLSNIVWGANVTPDSEGKINGKTAQEWAEALTATGEGSISAADFADIAGAALNSEPAKASTSDFADGKYEMTVNEAGYYLIKDITENMPANEAKTDFILEVVGDAVATPKTGTTTLEKEVEDTNDSTGEPENTWSDTADYDIGDDVPYKLTATLPSNYVDYKAYGLVFEDVQSAGLTFNKDSVTVSLDGSAVDKDAYTVVETANGFTLTISNLKTSTAFAGATNNSKVVVEYTCKLNEDADMTTTGNINTASLKYTNDPNWTGDGTTTPPPTDGKTKNQVAVVFTYKTVVNKKDENQEPLAGAEFTLDKFLKATKEWKAITVVKANDGASFTFNGLDDGIYRLTETQTPAGYNSIDPIYFQVTATHSMEVVEGVETAVTTLTVKEVTVETDNDGNLTVTAKSAEGNDLTFNIENQKDTTINADVVNYKGATLPETGGIGTTIFYVVGGALVVGAVVLLVTKKRMSNIEE